MFASVKRGAPRIAVMLFLGYVFFLMSEVEPRALGPVWAPAFHSMGITLISLAISDLALRILQPRVDAQVAAAEAIKEKNVAAGMVYLGRVFLAVVVMLMIVGGNRG